MTNFEKIKQMSVEELADKGSCFAACEYCPAQEKNCKCIGCDKAWEELLNSEVEE